MHTERLARVWLIRGPFLGIFALCVAAWAWSYLFREHIDFTGTNGGQEWVLEIGGGEVSLRHNWGGWSGEKPGWHYEHLRPDPWADEFDREGIRFLGFQFINLPKFGKLITVPFWFLTAASALGLLFLWKPRTPFRPGFDVCRSPRDTQADPKENPNGSGVNHN